MKTLSSDNGVYQTTTGFYIRPVINGKRTWRKLASTTMKDAKWEAAALLTSHKLAASGLSKSPFAPKCDTVSDAASSLSVTLPDHVNQFFGSMRLSEINPSHAAKYSENRKLSIFNGPGDRTCDLELSAISAMLSKCVRHGYVDRNGLAGWQRNVKPGTVRHCREVMPQNGTVLNRIAAALLPDATGWQFLFEAMTGCRTGEILAIRMDAETPSEPGFVQGDYLYVRRSKRGVFPFVKIHDDLRELIEAHRNWHRSTGTQSPYYFPGAGMFNSLDSGSLTRRLASVCPKLGVPKVTSHGLRAYFVTLQRSRGLSNEQVAALIGDKTSALIETTYGALPESWSGGEPLSWRPAAGITAWSPWYPQDAALESKIVRLSVSA